MKVVLGLGNDGPEYRGTRHNVGFMVADRIADRCAVAFSARDGRIIYITGEGLRRSVALAELDRIATTLRNEERGAEVRLPI